MSGEYQLYFSEFASSLKYRIKAYRETHTSVQKNNPEDKRLQALEEIASDAEKKAGEDEKKGVTETSQSAIVKLKTHALNLISRIKSYVTPDPKPMQQNTSGLNELIKDFVKDQTDILNDIIQALQKEVEKESNLQSLEKDKQHLTQLLQEKEKTYTAQQGQIVLAEKLAESRKEALEAEQKKNSNMAITLAQPDNLTILMQALANMSAASNFARSNFSRENGSFMLNGNGENKDAESSSRKLLTDSPSGLFSNSNQISYKLLPEEYQIKRPENDAEAKAWAKANPVENDNWKLSTFLSDARRYIVLELTKLVKQTSSNGPAYVALKNAIDIMLETYDKPCSGSWDSAKVLIRNTISKDQMDQLNLHVHYSDVIPKRTRKFAYDMLVTLYHDGFTVPRDIHKKKFYTENSNEQVNQDTNNNSMFMRT